MTRHTLRIGEEVRPSAVWTVEVRASRTRTGRPTRCGRLLHRERTNNVILDGGGALMAKQLGGQTPLFAIGLAAGQSNQVAVAAQTGLIDERFRGAITSAIPAGRSITFRFFMGTQQGNGFTYAEVALVTSLTKGGANDIAINRAVVAPIAKNDAKTITYACTVTF